MRFKYFRNIFANISPLLLVMLEVIDKVELRLQQEHMCESTKNGCAECHCMEHRISTNSLWFKKSMLDTIRI